MLTAIFNLIAFLIVRSHAAQLQNPTTKSHKYDIRKMLIDEAIIPDVLPDLGDYQICKVVYNGTIEIIPGQHVAGKYCYETPEVTWDADNDTYYTLYLSASNRYLTEVYGTPDPAKEGIDYPRRTEWESWVVINIPGNNVSKGHLHADYITPAYSFFPQIKEYYVFLIYEQPYKFDHISMDAQNGKQWPDSFQLKDFVKMYNLKGPIAINYFTQQWDEEFSATMSSLQYHHQSKNNFMPLTDEPVPTYRDDKIHSIHPKVLEYIRDTRMVYLVPQNLPTRVFTPSTTT